MFKKSLNLPWDTDSFRDAWAKWKLFKKQEKGFHFKGMLSEQAALKNLAEISEGDELNAIAIIDKSIYNGWSGLFGLKKKNDNELTKEQQEYLASREDI